MTSLKGQVKDWCAAGLFEKWTRAEFSYAMYMLFLPEFQPFWSMNILNTYIAV